MTKKLRINVEYRTGSPPPETSKKACVLNVYQFNSIVILAAKTGMS